MGRKPIPTALKLLTGNPGRGINALEPKPPRGLGEPPEYLTDLQKKEWESVAAVLGGLGMLTTMDSRAFEELVCRSVAVRVLRAHISRHGWTDLNDRGEPRRSPESFALQQEQSGLDKMLIEFGLTPVSRTKVHAQKDTTADDEGEAWFRKA